MMRYTMKMLKKTMERNGGSLDLSRCTGLTALPDNLTVGSWLDLSGCTGLTELPDNLTVGSWIYRDGRKFWRKT